MGAGQFLKDFKRHYHVKKSAEHRKRIMQRQQVAAERKDAIPFSQIAADQSPGKTVSHCQLVAYYNKHGLSGILRVYSKESLLKLCRAYRVRKIKAAQKKAEIANLLVGAFMSCESEYIPCHLSLSTALEFTTEVAPSGHVRLRIRRV